MNTKRRDSDAGRRDFLYALAGAAVGGTIGSHAVISEGKEQPQSQEGEFALGDLQLQSGTTLRKAKLAYKTHGRLNAVKSNVILYPTQYAAQHSDVEWIIGPGQWRRRVRNPASRSRTSQVTWKDFATPFRPPV